MKIQQKNIAKKFVSVLIVWYMIAGTLVSMTAPIAGSSSMPQPEPMGIEEVINGTFTIKDQGVVNVDGNITVNSGGTLKIINSTLNFPQDTNGHDYQMTVSGGSLVLQNSTITTGARQQAQWDPTFDMTFTNANLTMTDHSVLAFPGTLMCTNVTTYINDSWITGVYPVSRTSEPAWAAQFPTYLDAVPTAWWAGTSVDLTDSTNDGPEMRFLKCKNITVADSKIDALVENEDLIPPTTIIEYFIPTSITGDAVGSVGDIVAEDALFVTVLGAPNFQTLTAETFDVETYNDVDYVVQSVRCHAVYNTTFDIAGGYNGSDYVTWNLESGVPQNLFILQSNVARGENYSTVFTPTPTLTQISTLDINFQNTYTGVDGKDDLNFNLIELEVTLQPRYDYYPTMLTLDNSNMSVINSYISADWSNISADFGSKNAIDLVNGANLYLYNVSIDTGENDPLGIMPSDDPSQFVPYRVASGCEVYHYKWMTGKVVDKYNAPVEGAYVNPSFDSTNETNVTNVANNNSLSNGVVGSTEWDSEQRLLDYLNRTQPRDVTSANYNRTDANGLVYMPLLCEFINAAYYPNGEHVGNYLVNVRYYVSGNTSYYYTNTSCEFMPFPSVAPEENLVDMGTIALADLELPRDVYTSQGLIVNTTTGNLTMNAYGSGYEYPFILVEDDAVLDIKNAYLNMTYMNDEFFEIRVRDNGVLRLDNVVIESSPNTIQVILEDDAIVYFNNTNTSSYVNILASDNADVTLNRSTIKGNFDIIEQTSAVRLRANDTIFWQSLDNIAGSSVVFFNASYSTSGTFTLKPTDNSVVYLYRRISANVIDGVTPGSPIENVDVWLNSTSIEPGNTTLDQSGLTNSLGTCEFMALSNRIWAGASGPESKWTGEYRIIAIFRTHMNTTFIGLPDSDKLSSTDANRFVSIRLSSVLPDLDPPLTVWPSTTIGRGDVVIINTTVTNTGDSTAKNILVRFIDNFNGVNTTINEATIPMIQPIIYAPNNTFDLSFNYSWVQTSQIGVHTITVIIDPNNAILEQNESNNQNTTTITIGQQADLAFQFYSDIWFSESYIVVNRSFTIVANIWNLGDIDANNVTVSFYQGVGGIPLGNATVNVPAISASTPAYLTVSDGFNLSGTYLIYVVIDGQNNIPEVSEINNNNTPGRSLRIWRPSDITIDLLEFIVGGTPELEVNNRTSGTLRARVLNKGEMPESPFIDFFDGTTANLIGTIQLSALDENDYAYADLAWLATCNALTQNHTLIVQARLGTYEDPTGLSNQFESWLMVIDDRPDLWIEGTELLPLGTTEIPENTRFDLNVTFANSGINAALNVTVSVYNEVFDAGHWLGSASVTRLEGNGRNATVTVSCSGVSGLGDHDLIVVADPDTNSTDYVPGYPTLDIIGAVEESAEDNNDVAVTIPVILPPLTLRIILPATGENVWETGEVSQILVAVQVVRTDAQTVGVEGVTVTATIEQNQQTGTNISVIGGDSIIILPVPDVGNYTITVSAPGAQSSTQWFRIDLPPTPFPWWIIILIVIIVVAVIVGATLYLYFVGLGKTVQCGECGAFIPETAKKCPKCGVEFETEVAKCSVCGAWVPIDVKNCPECKTEFTVGAEELEDYETKMKRQYDAVVLKFKEKAKKDLGEKFTETEFQAWWAKQPTFMTFDQWLKEEEEMKRMGSKPCPACGTENSVTAKICHRCGTLMGEEAPKKPVGKMPEKGREPPKAPPAAAAPVAAPPTRAVPPSQPAQQQAPAAAAPPAKKKCPSCGMEVAITEKMCPICNHNFEAPGAAAPGGPQAVRVVRKPVKKIVRRMPDGKLETVEETDTTTQGQ